jgi:hypothetical protein
MAGLDPAIQTSAFRCWLPAQSPGFNSGSGATIRVTANEVLPGESKFTAKIACGGLVFHKKFGASLLFVLLGRIGATANMSRLDTEMANDLIAFARNLRSRGFVTRPSSTAPNRRGHAREAFR